MANDYWNNLVALVRRTNARAEPVNSIFSAIKAAWDLLPSKARLYEERVSYCVDSGAANAYVLTPTYAVTLTDGARVSFKALATNTAASVANVYGLGNVAVRNYAGSALSGGEIVADAFTEMRYNSVSAHWRIVNPVTAIASVSVTNNMKVSSADTTPAPLSTKLVAATSKGLVFAITSPSGDERYEVEVSYANLSAVAAADVADNILLFDNSAANAVGRQTRSVFLGTMLAGLAGLTPTASTLPNIAAGSTFQLSSLTNFMLGHLADATASAALTTLTAIGQGTFEIPVSSAAMWSPTTNGAEYGKAVEVAATKPTFFAIAFDATTKEYAQFALAWPKSLGTATVSFRPIWAHPATTTNFGVVFSCATLGLSDDDAANTAFGTAQTSTDTGGTTSDIYFGSYSSAITAGNSQATNDLMYFQIAREVADGSDTMAVDAYLIGIMLKVTVGAVNDA